jgi:hypothetical protein
MPFEIETGRIHIIVRGKNASIKRKNKIIPLPLPEINLIENDILITGEKTKIYLEIVYNKGKDKPNKDYKDRISKTIFMGPNSELELTEFEKWDVLDKKTHERKYGESIKNIQLKKGFFHVSYSNTNDPIITPVASIIFNGSSSGFFDVFEDKLYSSPQGSKGVEYTHLKTKKTFLAKGNTPEEIIITNDGIYRKSYVNMDEIFQNKVQILVSLQDMLSGDAPKVDSKTMEDQMKNAENVFEQSVSGFETLKQMKPEDFERIMKMSGQEMTPEMKEKFKEIPLLLEKMKNMNMDEQMKKSSAMMKGYVEGMGSENIEKYVNINEKMSEKRSKDIDKIVKDVEKLLEEPREYKPLTKEFGAVKVG